MTDADPLAPFRGIYASRKQARSVIEGHGGFERAVSAVLGEPLPNAQQAQRGDVVLTVKDGLAVVHLTHAFQPAKRGLALVPMCDWRVAWRVE
jgi:hypothetical protein